MIKSVIIDDNKNLPIEYSYKLESLKNGTRFDFINGTNIIIGKNGAGKSTLLKIWLLIFYVKILTTPNSQTSQYQERFSQWITCSVTQH